MRARALLAFTTLLLGGCGASGPLVLHRQPPQTPAADNAAAVALAATNPFQNAASARDGTDVALLRPADVPPMHTYDPWERMNRFFYRFNARFDEAVFLPVANSYQRLPGALQAGVHNFFGNLAEPTTVINDVLQMQLHSGVRSLGRFIVNSTIGIGGLFDVATKIRLQSAPTGFSATLGRWGLHPGPYLVIPILGPSTLRDGFGLLGDYGLAYGVNIADLYRGAKGYALWPIDVTDQRANTDFRYYASGSPFEYETTRFLYVHRELLEDEALHAKTTPTVIDRKAPDSVTH
jgi:phospholipid-binding lipoprotein MlaA